MNWNGQRPIVDHLIRTLGEPNLGRQSQVEYNNQRRARVQAAINVRPVYLPLDFEMNAAGQVSPYRATTPALGYDVVIIGIKTDTPTREIIIRRTEEEKAIAYVGEEETLFLRADEIAGITATNGAGQIGTFYWPAPIHIPRGNRMTIEMFKTDTTVDPEEANIVLVGFRVFNKALYGEQILDGAERDRIEQAITLRDIPRVVFLKQRVQFDSAVAGGEARNLFTPQVQEPLLIRGVRTTMRQSLIEVGLEGEPSWTLEPTPVWAVAGEDELGHDNYHWFPRPIFLHSNSTIEVSRVINSIDGTLIDAEGTGNENMITWLCETI
jgi:hypothetical protein